MRRIRITDRIKDIAKDFTLEMENVETFKKGENPKERLLALSKVLEKSSTIIKVLKQKATKGHPALYSNHKGSELKALSEYVKAIYDNYEGLNALLPSEWNTKIAPKVETLLSGYDISELKVKLPQKAVRPFYELVVESMRYDRVQKDIMPKYIRRLGIKTCVYCNAQSAITTSIQEIIYAPKGKYKVKNIDASCYELDHNKAKSVYPYLCTNFYNLQPSCSSCNRRKNNRDLDFSLYYEDGDVDTMPVHFALDPTDIIKFRTSNICKGVVPYLCNEGTDFPPVITDNISRAGKMNTMLGVQGIYNEYEDVVEELLWKHKIYSREFMNATIAQIKSLGLNGFDIKRFILGGYYDREDDFLKRPCSIMKNDLWEQLERTLK
jgi:hypothetical protein